jgi:hypothetical protein
MPIQRSSATPDRPPMDGRQASRYFSSRSTRSTLAVSGCLLALRNQPWPMQGSAAQQVWLDRLGPHLPLSELDP